MSGWFGRYLLPGFVFQSLVIGGGYGTGRELVEFFLTQGPVGGLLAMAVATIIWSTVLAISFELARQTHTYDYRRFLKNLLGRGWIFYELTFIAGLVLVVSVVGSASGELFQEVFGVTRLTGTIVMVIAVGILVYFGTAVIERALSLWSFALYGVYFAVVIWSIARFGADIAATVTVDQPKGHWFLSGVKYAAYNVGIIPVILFCTRHIETRREALAAGTLAGPIAMLPALFIYLSMLSQYPAIVDTAIPANALLTALGSPAFQLGFQIVLFGTFIETGVGLIHGLNERIAENLHERHHELAHTMRAVIGFGVLIISVFVADGVGLVSLISKGYGTLTWFYLLVFVLPVLTVGAWRIRSNGQATIVSVRAK